MPTTFSHPAQPSAVVVAALTARGFEAGPAVRTTITVLDTFDGRLHRAGLRLVLRRGTAQPELVLSADGPAPAARLRWSTAPAWPSELPAGPFRARLVAVTQERALLPLLTVTTTVRTLQHPDRRGKTTVAVAVHDDLDVPGAGDDADLPAWIAEILPVVGHDDAAEAVVTRLSAAGLVAGSDDLVALAARSAGVPLTGRDSSPTVPLEASDDALDAFRRVLMNLADTIEVNLDGTIADTDPEFLHELRVAVRRTRSILAHGKAVLPEDGRARYREVFGALGQVTGPPRDLDVQVMGWSHYVSSLDPADAATLEPVRVELEARRTAAYEQMSEDLRSPTTRDLLDGWRRWLVDPDLDSDEPQPIGAIVAKRIIKAQHKVVQDGRVIRPTSHPEMLHDLRGEDAAE